MHLVLFAILVALILVATLLPFSRRTVWWIRDLDFPRLQITILALVVLVAQLLVDDLGNPVAQGLIAVNALCLAYQAWWIIPYIAPPATGPARGAGPAPALWRSLNSFMDRISPVKPQ